MWGKARRRSKQGKKQRNAAQRNTRNVRPADFAPGLASHHGSHGRPGRGGGMEEAPALSASSGQWPVASTHRT